MVNIKQKKIGILTFHRAINYGAFLQCYSLSHYLQELFPDYVVEVIDYETFDEFIVRIKQIIKSILTLHFYETLIMHLKFRRERKSNLQLSKRRCISNKEGSLARKFKNEYNIVIVGSDAVWHKINFNFFLQGMNTEKYSYAASTSGLKMNNLSDDTIIELRSLLNDFVFIGAREDKTERFIESLNVNLKPIHTCDPTCFLNINKLNIDFEDKFIKNGISLSMPIICLMTSNIKVGKYVREAFHETHQIVSIYTRNKYADVFLYDLSPLEFAVFFKEVDILFSYFFHGCYLCLKNGKPVIAVDEDSEIDGNQTKIEYLFDRLGMLDRYFNLHKMNNGQYKNMIDIARQLISNNQRDTILSRLEVENQTKNCFIEALKRSINSNSCTHE